MPLIDRNRLHDAMAKEQDLFRDRHKASLEMHRGSGRLLSGVPMPYSLRAGSEAEVIAIPADSFKSMCARHPRIAREVEQLLSAREAASRQAIGKAAPMPAPSVVLDDRTRTMQEVFKA